MRDYLDSNKVKEQHFYCYTAFHSQSMKHSLGSGWVVFFTSIDKLNICVVPMTMSFWCIEFYFPDVGLSTKKQNTGEEILQILSSLCLTFYTEQ